MKAIVVLLLAFVGPTIAGPSADPGKSAVRTKISGSTVNVDIGFKEYSHGLALKSFLQALTDYPQARRFRISWSDFPILMGGADMTVLYDRSRHRITLYKFYQPGDDGGRGNSSQRLQFTHVQEEVFSRLAARQGVNRRRADRDEEDQDWDGFDTLSRYGCRKRAFKN